MKGIYWRIQRESWRRTRSLNVKMISAGRLLLMDYWSLDTMHLSASLVGKNLPLIPPVNSLSLSLIFFYYNSGKSYAIHFLCYWLIFNFFFSYWNEK